MPPTRIAFTSCSHIEFRPDQPVWDLIAAADPQLLLLLGDTVYMSYEPTDPWDFERLDGLYAKQLAHAPFRDLVKRQPTLAIWDDHDFGIDNACGADHPIQRDEALRLFLKHMMPIQARRPEDRQRVFGRYDGLPGIRVLMLDERYWREPVWAGETGRTMLGPDQEQWLFDELADDDDDVRITIACSGSTVDRGGPSESLRDYEPFFADLKKACSRRGHILLLTGDIHYNRFDSHHVDDKVGAASGLAFHEATSSGSAHRTYRSQRLLNNWGLLTVTDQAVRVDLFDGPRGGDHHWMIDKATWIATKVKNPT